MTKKQRQTDDSVTSSSLLFDATPDVMGIVEANGHFRTINPAWTQKLAHSFDELAGTSIEDLVHPDDLAIARKAWEQPDHVGTSEIRLRKKDGSYLWMEWWGLPVPDQSDVMVCGHDIESRKALEVQLSETERQFQDLVENANDAICTADLDGNLTSINHATEKLSGYSRSEIEVITKGV
jgi:PAS domain S-box-containing protein